MNDIVLQDMGGEPVKIVLREGNTDFPVDARQLWEGLHSKREFANWIKAKVLNNPFLQENQDFSSFDKIVKRAVGASKRREYSLTIDAAKRVAMAEQTERGEQVRRYFIECEKKMLQKSTFTIPQTYGEALVEAGRLALEVEGQKRIIEDQEQALIEAKPKIEGYDALMNTKTLVSISDAAREIGITKPRKKFFPLLRDKGYLTIKGLAITHSIDQGVITNIEQKDGDMVYPQAMIPRCKLDYWRKWAKKHSLLAEKPWLLFDC